MLTSPALVSSLVRRNFTQRYMQTRQFHPAANQSCRWGHLHATPRRLQTASLSRTIAPSQTVKDRQQCDGLRSGELRLRSLGAYVVCGNGRAATERPAQVESALRISHTLIMPAEDGV